MESKLECKESLIAIPEKGACQTKKTVRRVATDSIENIQESKELRIDIPLVLERARWPECCIYHVPKKLRNVNTEAYGPKLISIGPLRHGQPEPKEMELQKLRFLQEFCNRKRTREITQKELAGIIEKNEVKIRHCYASAANISKLSSKAFINMILLDAIFIIELFLRNATVIIELFSRNAMRSKQALRDLVATAVPDLLPSVHVKPNKLDADDYMFSDKWLSYHLRLDLLLLENQLPFFILKELWETSNCYSSSEHHSEEQQNKQAKEDTSFLKLAFAYFYELHPEHEQKPSWKEVKQVPDVQRCTNFGKKVKDKEVKHFKDMLRYTEDGKEVKHFTDMLRYFFYSKDMLTRSKGFDPKEDGGFIKHLYSATQLDEAGLKFKGIENKPLLDINFHKNPCLEYCPCLNCSWLLDCLPCCTCLEITQHSLKFPTFEVNDGTECIFRNLMAFEQCHSPPDSYICNYILLLRRLINSEKDVDLLVDERVIVNFLDSNERVANLVYKLCLEIIEPEESPYNYLSEKLIKQCRHYWNKSMVKLSRLY